MRADEVRMLAPGRGILISGRERPALVKMPAYFEVPVWRDYSAGWDTGAAASAGEIFRTGQRLVPGMRPRQPMVSRTGRHLRKELETILYEAYFASG
jgi:hypothetical protein